MDFNHNKFMNYLLNEGYESNIKVSKALGSKIYIGKKPYEDLSYGAGTLLLGHNSKVYKNIINNLKSKKISNYASPNICIIILMVILKSFYFVAQVQRRSLNLYV